MKTIIKLLIIFCILILLGMWSPWSSIDINLAPLFGVETVEDISGLQVYALLGTMEVYVDGELKGEVTPDTSPFFVDSIQPGQHQVELIRVSVLEDAYDTYNAILDFEAGIDTVISYGFGPIESMTEGSIVTVSPRTNESFNVQITSNVQDPRITINNIPQNVQNNRLLTTISLEEQTTVSISKPGYEPLTFTLLPEEQEDRDIFADYIIQVETQLMIQPVRVV